MNKKTHNKSYFLLLTFLLTVLLLGGCSSKPVTEDAVNIPTKAPIVTATPTSIPESIITQTPEPIATSSPPPENTIVPTLEPTLAPTSKPTSTSKPTLAPTSKPTSTPKPTLAPTLKPTSTPKPTLVPTSKPMSTPKPTLAPTLKPTSTPKPTPVNKDELSSIYKEYSDYFTIGAATSDNVLSSSLTKPIVLSQFNTITMENEMKPNAMLNYQTSISDPAKYNLNPALNLYKLDKYLKFAQDNGLKVRFHTLVWHSQTPNWFFKENYSMSGSAANVSKATMLKRMESYIKQIMEYTEKYPNVIYAWDVVNEAINDGDGKYRSTNSLWYQIIGEDFVEKAFEYARKYSYDDAGLFYNDYNTYQSTKRTAIYNMAKKLKEKGLIDGIGMQSHIDMNYPSLGDFEATIKKYAELDLQIHITELDMHNTLNTEAALKLQATRYKSLFEIFVKLKKNGSANITSVTFWGVLDSQSWLTNFKGATSYPLLFDKSGQPKPVFHALIDLVS